ncbi:MAG: serine/threonine-protein kinase [Planctomycetaceae bacterium]
MKPVSEEPPLNSGDFDEATHVPDDPRLLPIVREYVESLERGGHPNLEEFVARCPELSESIRACLEGVNLVHRSAQTSASRPASSWRHDAGPGPEPLGDFRILRELGRGGMGVVYEAIQTSLNRRVALKVLPFTATMHPRQLQRFLNEAQAAALLHHPHIVPVFAVGCDRGVHYYAMQLIEGVSLAELLGKLRRDAGFKDAESSFSAIESGLRGAAEEKTSAPAASETLAAFSSRLSTERTAGRSDYFRTVARFGLQAAEALSYAHEVGIVHRDIKPGNLLIDARGKLWVTDFGLAQVRSSGDLTQTGDLVGTLRYMSPEQVQGDRAVLDQRTDVYSLGATLYELATLRPMFAGGSRGALLNSVIHEDPPHPRTLNRAIPAELDTIILKAVSKSPHDRYGTAQEFADDLRRFLENQPIRARRPTPADHVRKWSRRHPVTVVFAGAALLAVSIGLLIHNRIIALEQGRTQARAIEAEQSFQQARQAVDLLIQIGEEELADKPPMQAVRKRLLSAALEYYQGFIASRGAHPSSQRDLAAVEQHVQKILHELAIVEGLFRVMPVMENDVQTDLHVTDEQRRQLQQFEQQLEAERNELFTAAYVSSEVRQQRLVEFAEKQANRLNAILTGPQQQRLRQISLQTQGVFAFQEPEVIEALELTTEQQRQIRELEAQFFHSHGPKPLDCPPDDEWPGSPRTEGNAPHPFGKKGRPDPNDFPPHEDRDRQMQATVQKVTALLTSDQLERWRNLVGDPYEGKSQHFRGGFPGGGPPMGGRGRHGPPMDHAPLRVRPTAPENE